ncbi:MAG: CTP-dependent riboflavin kinase [Nanoarchaeota archaeon]|nr:CTP-dependent riboflavin kinase [Nanoarchaeota archaeon]
MVKEFTGVVVSGKKEGNYYVSRYNGLFKEKLGLSFFPGTLNIKTGDVIFPEKFISISPVEEFKEVKCYKVVLNEKAEAFVVVPQMKRDENIIEIVSRNNLREEIGLNDNDNVKVRFVE